MQDGKLCDDEQLLWIQFVLRCIQMYLQCMFSLLLPSLPNLQVYSCRLSLPSHGTKASGFLFPCLGPSPCSTYNYPTTGIHSICIKGKCIVYNIIYSLESFINILSLSLSLSLSLLPSFLPLQLCNSFRLVEHHHGNNHAPNGTLTSQHCHGYPVKEATLVRDGLLLLKIKVVFCLYEISVVML